MKGITFLTIIRFTIYLLFRALPMRAIGALGVVVVVFFALLYNNTKFVHAEGRFVAHRVADSTEWEQRSLIDETEPPTLRFVDEGVASWYGPRFHGRRTACGERYNMHDFTAAHPTLPFGTIVRVTNLATMQSTLARVNDRGPYVGGRVIDVSYGAAKEINLSRQGIGDVKIEVLSVPDTAQLAVIHSVSGERHSARVEPLVTAIAFSPDIEPFPIKASALRILEETDNLGNAIKAWKTLRLSHKNVYLVAQKSSARSDELTAQAQRARNKTARRAPYYYRLALAQAPTGQAVGDFSD